MNRTERDHFIGGVKDYAVMEGIKSSFYKLATLFGLSIVLSACVGEVGQVKDDGGPIYIGYSDIFDYCSNPNNEQVCTVEVHEPVHYAGADWPDTEVLIKPDVTGIVIKNRYVLVPPNCSRSEHPNNENLYIYKQEVDMHPTSWQTADIDINSNGTFEFGVDTYIHSMCIDQAPVDMSKVEK